VDLGNERWIGELESADGTAIELLLVNEILLPGWASGWAVVAQQDFESLIQFTTLTAIQMLAAETPAEPDMCLGG
jgi:type II secretory pathway component PulL